MEDPLKKRRGRRRKNENLRDTTTPRDKRVKFKEHSESEIDGNTQHISFGNINIVVMKNKQDSMKIDLKNNSTNVIQCALNITKKELYEYSIDKYIINPDSTKLLSINKAKGISILKHYADSNSKGEEIMDTNILCYHCCHSFINKPCFLPYDYCQPLQRYKLYGNFCSPNCAKAYALNSKTFSNKVYLIGCFYRKLYNNTNLKIKPAPSIHTLKCFGGTLTIEQFRENFDNNVVFNLTKINAKIKPIELLIN